MVCENCNTIITKKYGSGRFCSEHCARGYSTRNKRQDINSKVSKTLRHIHENEEYFYITYSGNCLNCNKSISNKNKFCNSSCFGEYRRKIKIELWKKGEIEGHTIIKTIRRYLIETFGEYCWKCNWSERHVITGHVPIELNHIDGNWKNCKENNLEILCPNCHSLTLNFRALNKRINNRKVKGQRKTW